MLHENVTYWNPLDAGSPTFFEGPIALVMGVFDGLHVGHRALIGDAFAGAEQIGAQLVIVTFGRDPEEVFLGQVDKLCSNEDRLNLLASTYGCPVLALESNKQVLAIEPDAFLQALSSLGTLVAVSVGKNFRFGAHAAGTVDDIVRWCSANSCAMTAHELVEMDGETVSSTRIRSLLRTGDVAIAQRLLAGRAHYVRGRVVRGRGEGTGFGFATANLDLSENEAMLPVEGVYGGYAIFDGIAHPAAINVGVAKSFEGATAPIEAHIIDFEGDLYDKEVCVSFVEWLREPRVFSSTEELIETVTGNIQWVRDNLREVPA